MPGILCSSLADPHGEAFTRSFVLDWVNPDGRFKVETFSEPGFHLACVYHPAVCEGPRLLVTEGHVLAVYGNLYDDDLQGADGEALCQALLDRFLRGGAERLQHLNGRYDIAVWDRRARVLHWVGDRFGANRHYCHHRPGALHIACEVKALAPWLDAIEVDPAGLASMLTFGYHIGDLTILEGVHCLPNARLLAYRAGEDALRLERYWNYPYGEAEPLQGSEDELAEALHAHLTTALRRQLRGVDKILLPISGGLDSRTMAELLHQSGFEGEVLAYGYGQASSRDVRYGRAIARKLGYRHVVIPAPPDFLTRHLEDAAWRFDAEWSAKNAWIRYAHRYLDIQPLGGHAALHGLMGDIILGSDLFGYRAKAGDGPQPIETLRQAFLQGHVSYMPLAEIGTIFPPEEATRIEARLNGILDHTLESSVGVRPYYALQRAEFEHRQQRRTAWLVRCVEEDLPALTPFLDKDLVDFATRIPYPLFHNKHLYKHMIGRHLPKAAAIPLSDTGLPLSPTRYQAGMAWRMEGLLQAVPPLKRYWAKRDEMIDFRGGLREQLGFFRQRLGILEQLSPPLAPGQAVHRMEALLAGTARPPLQACALLPTAVFMRKLRSEINQRATE